MRTVWLALFCLIGLAIAVAMKVGMSPDASADLSRVGSLPGPADVSREAALPAIAAESGTIAANVQSDTLTKGDRLELSYPEDVKSVKSVAITPGQPEPKLPNKTEKTEKIVSRHWHDPFDNRGPKPAIRPSATPKSPKAGTTRPQVASERTPKP